MTTASVWGRAERGVVDERGPVLRPRRRSPATAGNERIGGELGAWSRRGGVHASHVAQRREVVDAGERAAACTDDAGPDVVNRSA